MQLFKTRDGEALLFGGCRQIGVGVPFTFTHNAIRWAISGSRGASRKGGATNAATTTPLITSKLGIEALQPPRQTSPRHQWLLLGRLALLLIDLCPRFRLQTP